jgi:hypothetical protein
MRYIYVISREGEKGAMLVNGKMDGCQDNKMRSCDCIC